MEIAGIERELIKSNRDCWYRKRVNERLMEIAGIESFSLLFFMIFDL